MKIIRYQDSNGRVSYGAEDRRIEGDLFGRFTVTSEKADVKKLLAPIVPLQILCIGLNYRGHAQETHAKLPEYPVLFTKGLGTVQNPGRSNPVAHAPQE